MQTFQECTQRTKAPATLVTVRNKPIANTAAYLLQLTVEDFVEAGAKAALVISCLTTFSIDDISTEQSYVD
jgi:hypothetical protein